MKLITINSTSPWKGSELVSKGLRSRVGTQPLSMVWRYLVYWNPKRVNYSAQNWTQEDDGLLGHKYLESTFLGYWKIVSRMGIFLWSLEHFKNQGLTWWP